MPVDKLVKYPSTANSHGYDTIIATQNTANKMGDSAIMSKLVAFTGLEPPLNSVRLRRLLVECEKR